MGLFQVPDRATTFLKVVTGVFVLGILGEVVKGQESEIEVLTPSDFNIAQGRTVSINFLNPCKVLSHLRKIRQLRK